MYNPDQPRDPAGTSTGGQWTSIRKIEHYAYKGAEVKKKFNGGLPYYRYTNSDTRVMSEWGYAMFGNDKERVGGMLYGGHAWEFDANSSNGVYDILDLEKETRSAWEKTIRDFEENGYYIGANGEDLTDFINQIKDEGKSFDDVFSYLNPKDIVDSAEAWDSDLGIWFYANVAEPNGVLAVVTNDGAIVWDESLIKRVSEYDYGAQ